MDAIVFNARSNRGRKYAYVFVCQGPSSYQEGFTLVLRSDIIDVFFPMVEAFRLRFAGRHPWPLFAELLVDCAGEHTSKAFRDKCREHGIELIFPSMRKQNMGLAEVTMKHTEMGIKTSMLEVNALAEEWEGHFFDTLAEMERIYR